MDWSILFALIAFTTVAFSVAAAYLLLSRLADVIGNLLLRFRPSRPVSCRPGVRYCSVSHLHCCLDSVDMDGGPNNR